MSGARTTVHEMQLFKMQGAESLHLRAFQSPDLENFVSAAITTATFGTFFMKQRAR
jgi:hypothetical protein